MVPALGDRDGQRFAVPTAIATEVSGGVGRSVHGNLGGAGSCDLTRGNRGLQLGAADDGGGQCRAIPQDDRIQIKVTAVDSKEYALLNLAESDRVRRE